MRQDRELWRGESSTDNCTHDKKRETLSKGAGCEKVRKGDGKEHYMVVPHQRGGPGGNQRKNWKKPCGIQKKSKKRTAYHFLFGI